MILIHNEGAYTRKDLGRVSVLRNNRKTLPFYVFSTCASLPTQLARTMARANSVQLSACTLWPLIFAFSILLSVVLADEVSLVVAESASLQISPGLKVEKSPGSKPGTLMACERVQIHGLSRIKGLRKFAHTVKLKVMQSNASSHLSNVEVCFHRNMSLGIGMCPQGHWEKLVKGSWVRSMSPFDHKILDIRVAGSSFETIEVSIEDEFFLYRVIFLALGIALIMLASALSKSTVFYYCSAMTVGVVLVILMVLFQGMRLLPTGRRNSLAIFMYSSIVGLGSFLLRFLPGLVHSILVEIGISEDMYYPLGIFLLAFVVLVGAWLGFWVVRKLVFTEDGSVDISTSLFVAWSIRILGAVMILQSCLDPLLAAAALFCGILASSMLRKLVRSRFLRQLYRKLFKRSKRSRRRSHMPDSSPLGDSYDEYIYNTPRPQPTPFSLATSSDSGTYYSTFHTTPERRKFSKEEWEKFTRDSTKKALEDLVSSPDFTKWAVVNSERITVSRSGGSADRQYQGQRRWLSWI